MKYIVLLVLIAGCHFALIDTVTISPSLLPRRLISPAADSFPKCVPETIYIKRNP